MKKTKQFRPTALILNAKMKVSLMLLLMLMLVPQGAWAIGGSGTSSSPYTIEDAYDLWLFLNKVNSGETNTNAKLTADIVIDGTFEMKPIGTSSRPYTGTFDGQGHTISGFSMEGYTKVNAGFFGYVKDATIKNFTLNGTMTSSTQITSGENDCSGAVVGRAMGSSTIQDIVSNVNIALTKAQKHLGGVVGAIEGSTVVKGCTYTGTLDAGPSTDCIGGIVGFAPASCSASIFYCFFNGTLSSSSSTPTMGGILGYTNDESNNFSGVHDCYSCGTFSFGASDYKYVNAIVGRIRNRATTTINNTYLSGIATRACNTDGPSIPASNKAITISVTANANGTVSQSYVNPTTSSATQLQVVATPNEHYHFGSWSDSGAQTHNVGLTDNVSLSASFAIDQHTITVNVANGQSSMGTVSGGGTFDYNSTKTITATPKEHYHFVQWNDGVKTASRQITVTGNATYTATFAIDQHTITVQANNGTYGNVTGGGTYNYGTQQTITATPKTGYHFVKWSDNNTNASRTITVSANATYTATFAAHTYGDAVWTWASDGSSASAKITCTACDNVLSGNATITNKVKTAATCEVKGTTTYTAKVTLNNREYTATKDIQDIAVLGHDFTVQSTDAAYQKSAATCTTDAVYYHKCSRCDSKGSTTWTKTGSALGHDINDNQCSRCDLKAKAVYADGTLTFYFDDVEHSGTTYSLNAAGTDPEWYTQSRRAITDVVFDASFAAALPTSCYEWFDGLENLRSITGIEYLNTQKVTDMGFMFSHCSSLQSLNLRSFDTEKVTSMYSMFSHCNSLTSLDLNSFNTENVEDMEYLFRDCRNLQELTIGNNFTIKQNTNTEGMWWFCNALNTLNLKSLPFLADGTFNTQFSGDGKTVNVILDDNSEIYTDGTNYLPAATSATFNREIVADGGMYSFIVPFDIPAGQAAELGKFYQYTSHDPEERKVYFDDIAEVSDGVVKANTAYFFKPARDITSFTVNNPSIPRTLTIPDPEYPSVPGLYGTYSEIAVPQGAYGYAMLDGQSTFVKAGYGNALWPFRAYLWLGSGAYMARARAIFGEEEVNGIIEIDAESENDIPAYDLSGQRVTDDYKGIVIKNGKKTMVK